MQYYTKFLYNINTVLMNAFRKNENAEILNKLENTKEEILSIDDFVAQNVLQDKN